MILTPEAEREIRSIFQEELANYFRDNPFMVEAKDHYEHHQFIGEVVAARNMAKSYTFRAALIGLLSLAGAGLALFFTKYLPEWVRGFA